MANIDKHPAGSFCWVELATTDQNAAKTFYTSLFGWTVDDSPMGPGDFYSMFRLSGRDTGAGYTMRKEQRAQGVPPNWMIYLAVENADQAASKAAQAGGTVLSPAFDVMDAGRMAVIQDPTGAIFSVWQPKNSKGIGISGDNAFCWREFYWRNSSRHASQSKRPVALADLFPGCRSRGRNGQGRAAWRKNSDAGAQNGKRGHLVYCCRSAGRGVCVV
jgi:predicted enzyme related to lactoylglutathione lyase